jgi:hypothetical protein
MGADRRHEPVEFPGIGQLGPLETDRESRQNIGRGGQPEGARDREDRQRLRFVRAWHRLADLCSERRRQRRGHEY